MKTDRYEIETLFELGLGNLVDERAFTHYFFLQTLLTSTNKNLSNYSSCTSLCSPECIDIRIPSGEVFYYPGTAAKSQFWAAVRFFSFDSIN